jgi:hypothetical protein
VDREGTVDDLSKGFFFSHAFPPYFRHSRNRTRAKVGHAQLDNLMLASLADHSPRSGWRRPRIVENSDTSYFIYLCIKKMFTGMLFGVVTAFGEARDQRLRGPHPKHRRVPQ